MQIKIMVVDDSAFMRKAISGILEKDSRLKVVAFAKNGKEACEKAKTEDIDVITMDVEMPELNGIEATKIIMEESPVPIIMLSSLTNDGSHATLKALENGAIDFIQKPSGNISLDIHRIEIEIVSKVIAAANSRIRRIRTSNRDLDVKKEETVAKRETFIRKEPRYTPNILVIGTSTGGPKALQYIIPELPKLDVPVVIAQHMPAGFTAILAESLDKKSKMRVKEGEHNEELEPNIVYIAPGGKLNTIIKRAGTRKVISIVDNEQHKKIYTPSVDLLMESTSSIYMERTLGVILTGMGNDGLEGFKALKANGGYSIAESSNTAVVYGMPRVVIEANLADDICELQDVPKKIMKIFKL